jgi:hypothetical protein
MNYLSIRYEKHEETEVISQNGKVILDCYSFVSHNGNRS